MDADGRVPPTAGRVYRLPAQALDLADYFNFHDPLDMQELHQNLLRTWQDREPIFGEKSLALVHAAVQQGHTTGEHPLGILARWAELAAPVALREAFQYAPTRILQFTDGDDVDDEPLNRFAQSAWGTFTTRVAPLVPHIHTVTWADVPKTWVQANATLYLTYPLDQLPSAGPLVSCVMAACIKAVMRRTQPTPVLFALDEVPATALAKLDTYLATLGSYGGTLLLYLQALPQLDDVYGQSKAQTILGNCHTKLFYPPRDLVTAEHVSKVFGTELRFVRADNLSRGSASAGGRSHSSGPHTAWSYTEKEVPAFAPTELDALPAEAVIVLTQAQSQIRMLAERLNLLPLLGALPCAGYFAHPVVLITYMLHYVNQNNN